MVSVARRLLPLFLLACAPAYGQSALSALGVGGASGASLATPGFISESGKNSTLTVALGSFSSGVTISAGTCANFSFCLPYPETSLSGNIGIVPYQYANGGSVVAATATDDLGDTYTCINPSATDSNKLVGLCYSANLPGTTSTNGAHKVSITFGTTAVTQVMADTAMFYNVATTSPLDGSVQAVSGTSSTTATGPTLSTSASDLVFACVYRTGTPLMTSGSFTPGSGFTFGLVKYQDGSACEFKVSAGGNVTPTMTMGSASSYLVIAAAFKASTGPAGTAPPTTAYAKRIVSWSSASGVSAATTKFQFPNDAGSLLAITEGGGTNYAMNSITDSGSNVWTQAGQCAGAGSCNVAGYTSEFYSQNAGANSTNTQTMNFTGTGDATVFFYEFANMPPASFTNRGQFGSTTTTTTLLPATAYSFTPWANDSVLTIAAGDLQLNTAVSQTSPSASNYFDGGFFGGESFNGGGSPESVIDQNNVWSHIYQSTVNGAQSEQFGSSVNTSQSNGINIDFLSFVMNLGTGIIHTATAQGTSGSDLQVTVPATQANNLLVVTTGFWDNATIRTVSKVCTGSSATCATGTLFTQVPSAAAADISTLLGTDIWVCGTAACTTPGGVTTITVVYSGAVVNDEIMYYEVADRGGGTWVIDNSGNGAHVANGSSSAGTETGPAITSAGTAGNSSFCATHFASSNNITANPKSGDAFNYASSALTFNSGGAANSLLSATAGSKTPHMTVGSASTFNASVACFH